MTEHAAVVFVFFFLAEYGSIVLMCILTAILFLGGYLYFNLGILEIYNNIIYIINFILNLYDYYLYNDIMIHYTILNDSIIDNVINLINYILNTDLNIDYLNNSIVEGLLYGLSLGLKSSILIFIFI
jgi:NADH-ubiquinone oxidoreductase chain 1